MFMNHKKEIIAVIDPMCSWCWGFEPVLQELQNNLSQDTKLSLCMGGLRSSNDQEWTSEFRSFLKQSWTNVHKQTGQIFNFNLLKKESFDYDTEPACRAVLTVQTLDEKKVFSFLHSLQKSFYYDNLDITQTNILANIAENEGINKKEFLTLFPSKKMQEQTLADKYKSRSMGASSFPSLVFIDEEGHLYVLKGYKSFQEIQKHL